MTSSKENVFRFMNIRPAKVREKTKASIPLYRDEDDKTAFSRSLDEARDTDAFPETAKQLAKALRSSPAYVADIDRLAVDIGTIADLLEKNHDRPLSGIDFDRELTERLGTTLDELIDGDTYRDARAALADTILCDAILGRARDKAVGAFKVLGILRLARDVRSSGRDAATPDRLLRGSNVILPELIAGMKPGSAGIETSTAIAEKIAEKQEQNRKLRHRLEQLEAAHRELSVIAADGAYLKGREMAAKPSAKAARTSAKARTKKAGKASASTAELAPFAMEIAEPALPSGMVKALSSDTKDVLRQLKLEGEDLHPERTVHLIEGEMTALNARLAAGASPRKLICLNGMVLDADEFAEAMSPSAEERVTAAEEADIEETAESLRTLGFNVGVGDLLMVEQTLKAYELADFAHVENVLAGEERDRQHRRLNVREEISELETEEETQTERDLQSTERNEMQAEAEKVVRSQFQLDAGVHVTAAFGTAISLTAGLDVGFSRATEESKRKAEAYAREVTERSSERVRQRVREQQFKRVLEEIEETNRHLIANATNKHSRGIYRWLNKIYDARIVNYGQRMMFEFTIPEPAAYYLYALTESPLGENVILEPEPPQHGDAPLAPQHITRSCGDLIGQYGVTNAPICPPNHFVASYFDAQDSAGGGGPHTYSRAGKLEIPSQYKAYGAIVSCDYSFPSALPADTVASARVFMGKKLFDFSDCATALYKSFHPRKFFGDVAFTAQFANSASFALAIDARCELTDAAFHAWQQDMYDAVIDAYTRQRLDYEAKMASLALHKGISVQGQNPLENRKIEREELKKQVIMMLMRSPKIIFNAFYPHDEPLIDIDKAADQGADIRFFEHAFEWTNMLYVFYPYFWGRRPKWSSALQFTDPDPDFAAFLKAGAARVQVPVRPGFEQAIACYCQSRVIPDGNDAPLKDDDIYLPIIDEITANMDRLEQGAPYPDGAEPWEVRVPSSLVLVQNLDEIPEIRDILTGDAVSITDDA